MSYKTIKDIIFDTFTNPGDDPRRDYSRNGTLIAGFLVLAQVIGLLIIPVGGALVFLNLKGVDYSQCTGYISASSGANLDNFNKLTVAERSACTVFEVSALGMVPTLFVLLLTSLYFLSGIPTASTRVVFFLLSVLVKSPHR